MRFSFGEPGTVQVSSDMPMLRLFLMTRSAANVQAVQLELAQRAYMNEGSREFDHELANTLRDTLQQLVETLVASATVQ